MMKEKFEKVFLLGFGLAMMGKEQLEKTINEMVSKGELSKDEAKAWMDKAISKGSGWAEELEHNAEEYIQNLLQEKGFATKKELELLKQRIEALEQQR